jgi:acetyltransferase-like isoleucine patch superfamily enzyme
MKIPEGIARIFRARYLKRKGVQWKGKMPYFDILNPPQFAVYGTLLLGSSVKFFTHMGPTLIQVDKNAYISMGDYARIGSGVWMRAGLQILIEKHVLIAPGVKIFDHHMHPVSERYAGYSRPVKLGRNTWIGLDSLILPGVEIGNHSIVGGGSVVTRNVSPKTVVAGNPALMIDTIECSDDWVRGECD